MGLKILFLKSHIDFCRNNLKDYSEENGDSFHQDKKKYVKYMKIHIQKPTKCSFFKKTVYI